MAERKHTAIEQLRAEIERLPRHTRVAMLEGLDANEIIVGAYSRGGGICPMLAAHRAGGRTCVAAFARAWDQLAFRGARRGERRARRATERELLILRAHLQASLLEPPPAATSDPPPDAGSRSRLGPPAAVQSDLALAVAEHHRLVADRRERERERAAERSPRPGARDRSRDPRPGDRDRSRELGRHPGWSWSPVVRRYEDYERALARLQDWPEESGARAPGQRDSDELLLAGR